MISGGLLGQGLMGAGLLGYVSGASTGVNALILAPFDGFAPPSSSGNAANPSTVQAT